MKVTVEGVITSKELKRKDDKVHTILLLAQQGEKTQTSVRLQGDVTNDYELYEVNSFTGNLFAWRTRDGVDMMVSVNE